jgi:hypothetical protein
MKQLKFKKRGGIDLEKEKIEKAIESLYGLNNLEWYKVKRIIDDFFAIKTRKIVDKLEFTDIVSVVIFSFFW